MRCAQLVVSLSRFARLRLNPDGSTFRRPTLRFSAALGKVTRALCCSTSSGYGSFFDAKIAEAKKKQAEPVRVIVFGSKKEYHQYRPNEFAAAFYTQRAGRDYIVLGSVNGDAFPIAVHEYVHLVVQHIGLNLPPWLNEGMAELYSTLKTVGDKVIVGNVIPGRMLEISQEKWVPLSTILAATSDSPYYNEKNKAGSLYNEGWALTHMLELSPVYPPLSRVTSADRQRHGFADCN